MIARIHVFDPKIIPTDRSMIQRDTYCYVAQVYGLPWYLQLMELCFTKLFELTINVNRLKRMWQNITCAFTSIRNRIRILHTEYQNKIQATLFCFTQTTT